MSQTSIPAGVEDLRRSIELDGSTLEILRREMVTGATHEVAIAELEQRQAEAGDKLATLEQRWQEEKALVGEIQALRGSLEAPGEANAGRSPPGRASWPRRPGRSRPCRARRRCCSRWSMARPWPKSSPPGPAFRSAAWSATRSAPC
ncbi:MAG: hypothetical protein WDN69_04670 [Aliidongia sp.]